MKTRPIVLSSLLATVLFAVPRVSGAVVRAQSDYPFEQVWNAAVRLIRVDLGFEVTERDAEGGYVLFKYQGESGTYNASIEVARIGSGKVGIVCQIPQMPRYAEIALVDRLTRKMRDDYGAPPPRPAVTAPPAAPARARDRAPTKRAPSR